MARQELAKIIQFQQIGGMIGGKAAVGSIPMNRLLKYMAVEGSLLKKFGVALLVALVLVLPPILISVDLAARHAIQEKLVVERAQDMRVHAAALSKPLYDFDYANLQRMASIIATANDIDRVEVADAAGVVVAASSEARPALSPTLADAIAIRHEGPDAETSIGTLRLWFNGDVATQAIRDLYWRTSIVVILSLSVVFLALMASLRQFLSRPLGALTSAIEGSRVGEQRLLAEWRSRDEVGRLVAHFNAMQSQLSEEESKLKRANANLYALYHDTPAMLFSVDAEGRIVDVSEYWLAETGYPRDEAIEAPFSSFFEAASFEHSGGAPVFSRGGGEPDGAGFKCWNSRFRKKSGEVIDVYVSEAARPVSLGCGERRLMVMVDISDLKRAEDELLRRARTDSLTGLPNRRHFKERLTVALEEAEAGGARIDVLFIDLDRFKWVNDHLGHHAGDDVLNISAARIRSQLPEDAFFARLGGDEFALFLRDRSDAETALVSTQINEALAEPMRIGGRSVRISASIGVAAYPQHADTVGALLKAADQAMYRTKRSGRCGFSSYDESIGAEARRLFAIEEMMKSAPCDERFFMVFQPVLRLSDQRVVAAEGLLRMRDPQGRVVPPGDFIAVAEECGLMRDLGAFALRRGAADFAGAAEVDDGVKLSINLSALQVVEELPEQVAMSLHASGFPADRLTLEITESVFLKHDAGLLSIFERLKAMGCRLALDDFGTGYSSLSYLSDFPVDIVKIDRQFVRRLDIDAGEDVDPDLRRRARSLLQGVAAIAKELDFLTVAEGVETQAQRRIVTEMGIDYGQGFLWSKPVDPASLARLLRAPVFADETDQEYLTLA